MGPPPLSPPRRTHGRNSSFRGLTLGKVAALAPVFVCGGPSVADYFGGLQNIPDWCRGCEQPQFLSGLQENLVTVIFTPSRWIMQGFIATATQDYWFAFISLAVARRLAELTGPDFAGTDWEKQADRFLVELVNAHPAAAEYIETYLPVLWKPYSTMVLDFLAERLLQAVVKNGKQLLKRDHLVSFTEALATSHDHIIRPVQLVPRSMLALPGLRRAAKLRECWSSGYFRESFESIEARQYRHGSSNSLDMRLVYVRNYKVASSTVLGLFHGGVGGPTPYRMGRLAAPGHTWFTFVRDPVQKFISAFFQLNDHAWHYCGNAKNVPDSGSGSGGGAASTVQDSAIPGNTFCQIGLNPYNADTDNEVHQRAVMERFLAMLADLEARRFTDQHTDSQAER